MRKTIFWGIFFFVLILFQFPAEQRTTLFFINKALAQTGVVLIGLSFLLGPLCKIFPFLIPRLHYRRSFGLVGFGVILLHILTSLLQLPTRFPLSWYQDHLVSLIVAILALLIFLVLALTSTKKALEQLGGQKWKFIQRTGYIALSLALIHIALVASQRWQLWLAGKVTLPTSFLVFAFGVLVIVARIIAFLTDRLSPKK